MVIGQDSFWRGKRVLITGHTGFKGSWLSLWLAQMGASVEGFALDPPTQPSCFDIAHVRSYVSSHIGDIRDLDLVGQQFRRQKPEVVFHLAAQPLVRQSYQDPVETYLTNVMGTVNVLENVRKTESVRVAVVVTSDKCYENRETDRPYRECDPLGGHDPYSSSKGCAELVSAAYRRSYFNEMECAVRLATARAGNVIGGGDWAKDRLVPDCLRALDNRETIVIRRPASVRPWQHVLEPLAGYLVLAEKLWEDAGNRIKPAYNFGPSIAEVQSVASVVAKLIHFWGNGSWVPQVSNDLHEAGLLSLDSTLAHNDLGWRPVMCLNTALEWTVEWFRAYRAGVTMDKTTLQQIDRYQKLAVQASPTPGHRRPE